MRHRLRQGKPLVLAIILLFFLAGGGYCDSTTNNATEPQISGPVVPEAVTPEGSSGGVEKAVDETHASIEQNILDQVIRLDNFFGNVKSENQRQTKYQLRWRSSLRIEDGKRWSPGTTLRANVTLSKISDRLRLAISGEEPTEPASQRLPEDPGNPGFDRTTQSTRLVNTELRYFLLQTPLVESFLGAGVRIVLPPEAFVRSRSRLTHRLSDVSLLRLGETLFLKSSDGLGETTEIEFEKVCSRNILLRWANAGTIATEIKGMEWGSELSLIKELSSKSAITLTGGVYGNTSAAAVAANRRVLVRYRRNFLKSWLFYELEPEISWPRNLEGHYPTSFAITFRLEVVFQGTAKNK